MLANYTKTDLLLLDTLSFSSSDSYPTLLMKSIATSNTNLAKILIENEVRLFVKGEDNITALSLSASAGHLDLVIALHQKGANLNEYSIYNHSALSLSSKHGHYDIAKYLIENNANINHRTYNGTTPLIYASLYGYKKIVKLLLDNGALVSNENDDKMSALICAAMYGRNEIVSMLLDVSASNIDAMDKDGKTALMYAAENGHLDVVNLLINHGANIGVESGTIFDKFTAQSLARRKGYKEIADLLKSKSNNRTLATYGGVPTELGMFFDLFI